MQKVELNCEKWYKQHTRLARLAPRPTTPVVCVDLRADQGDFLCSEYSSCPW